MSEFTRLKATVQFDCVVCNEPLEPGALVTAKAVREVAEDMARQLHYTAGQFPGRVAVGRPIVTLEESRV